MGKKSAEVRRRKKASSADAVDAHSVLDDKTPIDVLTTISRQGQSEVAKVNASRILLEHQNQAREDKARKRQEEITTALSVLPQDERLAFLELQLHEGNPEYGVTFGPLFAKPEVVAKLVDGGVAAREAIEQFLPKKASS
jgi:hypothetical protein